ncbi:MAG TPA: tRNA (guanosine(46)-N7)-methyltransferase TrmB [Stellaceae bacterium]|nr:tRNA (guanosine(46)-N7)-methyltransferase TrmB [Stellaceae bacterium]
MSARDSSPPRLVLYGRRRGRALRSGQRQHLETTLPLLSFALPAQGAFDPRALFAAPVAAIWLELGFGGGEHLAAQAEAFPEIGFIGAEVYANGVAKCLAEIERRQLANIRILMNDARPLVAALAEGSVARVFVLFPDPWPKERHKKRRLVARGFLDDVARAMADEGELRLATDDRDYAQAMLDLAGAHADFRPLAGVLRDRRDLPADWPPTRYEHKAIAAGRKPVYLRFLRRARGGAGGLRTGSNPL